MSLGNEQDSLFLVYPFIEGITLKERLRKGPFSVSDTIYLGRRLMVALRETHEQRILHCDIKTSNVILSDELSKPSVTLIDFGFARSLRPGAEIRGERAGTASYMSPEQAGLINCDVDERSDLYSVGVVLYECLAGACPFEGQSIGEVLRKHLTFFPEPLRNRGLRIPRALDELIQRLLARIARPLPDRRRGAS